MKTLLLNTFLILSQFQAISQVSLDIVCLQNSSTPLGNQISMDGNLVEYGLCTNIPSFYITVINTDCIALGTMYNAQNIENDFGYSNQEGVCRDRVEYYFIYRQNDSLDLVYMDSLLNYWIPNDYVTAIWTPIDYNYESVNTLCPQLGSTLFNKWGSEVEADSMIVLFGVQGIPESYSVDTVIIDGAISVNKTICPYSSVGVKELAMNNEKYLLKITDLMGRESEDKPNTLLLYIYSDGTIEKVFKVE